MAMLIGDLPRVLTMLHGRSEDNDWTAFLAAFRPCNQVQQQQQDRSSYPVSSYTSFDGALRRVSHQTDAGAHAHSAAFVLDCILPVGRRRGRVSCC